MAGIVQNAITRSMNLAFGASFLLAVTLATRIGSVWVLLSGGNIALAALLTGWFLGDRYRQL